MLKSAEHASDVVRCGAAPVIAENVMHRNEEKR